MSTTIVLFMLAAGAILTGWVYKLNYQLDLITEVLEGVDKDMTVQELDMDYAFEAIRDIDPKVFIRLNLEADNAAPSALELDAREIA